MRNPRPKPGARDSSDADTSLAGDASVSNKSRAPIQARTNGKAGARRRAKFARSAVYELFPYKHARALHQDQFHDCPPRKRARRVWSAEVPS